MMAVSVVCDAVALLMSGIVCDRGGGVGRSSGGPVGVRCVTDRCILLPDLLVDFFKADAESLWRKGAFSSLVRVKADSCTKAGRVGECDGGPFDRFRTLSSV